MVWEHDVPRHTPQSSREAEWLVWAHGWPLGTVLGLGLEPTGLKSDTEVEKNPVVAPT